MNVLSKLIVPSRAPDPDGLVVQVTPASAGWTYVGFEVFKMKAGRSLHRPTGDREACLVLLSGRANVATSGATFRDIGERMTVFERIPPYSVYVPSQDAYTVEALTDLELAVCLAPGKGGHPARLIAPEKVARETRGSGNLERYIHHILPEQEPADSLLVVEVFTPAGHWSSFPPHKHDQDDLPRESYLEETYYHRVHPERGFVMQRVYTDDRSLDVTMAVRDGDVVLVPRGYHSVSAPPGCASYYLNVMAGPVRTWKFHNDPDFEWIMSGQAARAQKEE